MVRGIFLTLVLMLGAAAYMISSRARAPAVPPAPASQIGANGQTCADDCEQRAIVEQASDAARRACIAHCPGAPAAMPPMTPTGAARGLGRPVGRITRAPADHHVETR